MTEAQLTIHKQPGTYAIVYRCPAPLQVRVGRLGRIALITGYWIYAGSAFGPGGLRSRVMHHLKPSTRPHWHLDYIKNALDPVEIWTTTDGRKREHDWAGMLMRLKGASLPIIGFGATDCACRSHLIHLPQRPGFTIFKRRVQAAFIQHGPLFRLVRRFPPDEPKPGCELWAFDRIP